MLMCSCAVGMWHVRGACSDLICNERSLRFFLRVQLSELQKNNKEFLGHALAMREDVRNTDEKAHDARMKLAEQRRSAALEMREKLREDHERRRQIDHEWAVATKKNHDDVIEMRFDPFTSQIDPMEREVKNEMIRQGLKARSRAWSSPSSPVSPFFDLASA